MPEISEDELARLHAAEEVCFTLLLMMGFGMLPLKEQRIRDFLAKAMDPWADAAVKAGLLKEGDEEEEA